MRINCGETSRPAYPGLDCDHVGSDETTVSRATSLAVALFASTTLWLGLVQAACWAAKALA